MSQLRQSRQGYARRWLRAPLLALLAGCAVPALAQADDIDEIAEPVVQPIPGAAGQRLNAALDALARNPSDVEALMAAGQAALGMGDLGAAVGFYQRASTLAPGNARIKAGLASAYVRSEDPFSAIPLFDEAEKAGPIEPALLGERALAYDLVGDNVTAQIFYKQALLALRDDETVRRLALSQAIAGDRRGMELTLAPLLQKQDKGAWRSRAFALAILGSVEEAESIARSSMPADLAGGISAYLRFMPRLTAAQQAAAANLGHFPRAAEVGRDDPRLAFFQRPRAAVARAELSLTPVGQPLGGDRRPSRNTRGKTDSKSAPAAPPPVVVRPVQVAVVPAAVSAAKPSATPVAIPPVQVIKPAQITVATPSIPAPVRNFAVVDPAQVAPAPKPVATLPPAKSAPVPAPPAKPRDLAEVFADFSAPSREAVPAEGAVDIRKVPAKKSATAKVEKEAKDAKDAKAEKKPNYPSRIWVQVATGRNKAALAFDWRRFTRENAKLFGPRKGHTSAWGQTNRLLTGPFESEKAATAFIVQLKKEKIDGAFVWTSPAGQVVDVLAAGK